MITTQTQAKAEEIKPELKDLVDFITLYEENRKTFLYENSTIQSRIEKVLSIQSDNILKNSIRENLTKDTVVTNHGEHVHMDDVLNIIKGKNKKFKIDVGDLRLEDIEYAIRNMK